MQINLFPFKIILAKFSQSGLTTSAARFTLFLQRGRILDVQRFQTDDDGDNDLDDEDKDI